MPTSNNSNTKKGFPYIATVIAFLAIVIMLGLGFWQLERKAQKEARLDNIQLAQSSASIRLNDISTNINEYQDYSVSMEGEPLNSLIFIDNKLVQGRAGFHVIVPYRTDIGLVLVNLGWTPSTAIRGELPSLSLDLQSKVTGIVYLPMLNTLISETNTDYANFPVLLQQVDLQEIEKHLGESVLPAVIRMNTESSDFVRDWQAITMKPEKHLAYAIQWFGLAIAALTVFLLTFLKRLHAPSPTGPSAK
jgi:cytochrome oxidase assembly protein ShyY1